MLLIQNDGLTLNTPREMDLHPSKSGLIPVLRPANERRRYFVTTSLIGWAQT